MSQTINIAGVDFTIPTTGEKDYLRQLNLALAALAEAATDALAASEAAQAAAAAAQAAAEAGGGGAVLSFAATGIPAIDYDFFLHPWYDAFPALDPGGNVPQGVIVPVAGTLSDLYCAIDTANPGDTEFTVYVNGGVMSFQAALTFGTTTANNTSDEIEVEAGDIISLSVRQFGAGNPPNPRCSLLFTPSPPV